MKSWNTPIVPRRLDRAVGYEGEITTSIDGRKAFVHDGRTAGGIPLVDNVGAGFRRLPNTLLIPNNRPLRIVGIGDSIMQNNSFNDSGQWQVSDGLWEASLFMAQGLGAQYRYVANMGIGGETTAQILARWQTDVLDLKPDVVFIIAGTNDLLTGMTDADLAHTMNNLEQMILMSVGAGIQVIMTSPPVKDLAPFETRRAQPYYYDLASFYNVPLLDLYRITCDGATGNYKAGLSDDGVHPNKACIKIIAAEGAKCLYEPWKFNNRPYLATYSEVLSGNDANMIPNGSFAQQTVPGTLDAWTVDSQAGNTYTCNTVPAQPYSGKEFIFTCTVPGVYMLFGPGIPNGMQVGDTLLCTADIVSSGLNEASSNGGTLFMSWDGAGTSARPYNVWPYNGDFFINQEIVVPVAFGQMIPSFYIQDACVMHVKNLTLTNKSARARVWAPGNQL